MKKLCLVYSNCQGDGIVHFLKKTRMANDFDFMIWHNWQLMLEEQNTADFIANVQYLRRVGGVAIYQPCKGYSTKGGAEVPGTAALFHNDVCPYPIKTISFAYQFNYGFFPFIKLGPGWDGWIATDELKVRSGDKRGDPLRLKDALLRDYFAGNFHYDCAIRFIKCLREQSRREEETDIAMAPWILGNFPLQRLFLTYNHPTSALFVELARRVLDLVYPEHRVPFATWPIEVTDENEAGMNGVQPLHPAVVKELGLDYEPTDHAIEYFADLLQQMNRELSTI